MTRASVRTRVRSRARARVRTPARACLRLACATDRRVRVRTRGKDAQDRAAARRGADTHLVELRTELGDYL